MLMTMVMLVMLVMVMGNASYCYATFLGFFRDFIDLFIAYMCEQREGQKERKRENPKPTPC